VDVPLSGQRDINDFSYTQGVREENLHDMEKEMSISAIGDFEKNNVKK
jgi:hypothetical protein